MHKESYTGSDEHGEHIQIACVEFREYIMTNSAKSAIIARELITRHLCVSIIDMTGNTINIRNVDGDPDVHALIINRIKDAYPLPLINNNAGITNGEKIDGIWNDIVSKFTMNDQDKDSIKTIFKYTADILSRSSYDDIESWLTTMLGITSYMSQVNESCIKYDVVQDSSEGMTFGVIQNESSKTFTLYVPRHMNNTNMADAICIIEARIRNVYNAAYVMKMFNDMNMIDEVQ